MNNIQEWPYLMLGKMRSFNLPIKMRVGFFNINMTYPKIFAMPIKKGLEFMDIIRLDGMYSKWDFTEGIVNKINSVFLAMPVVNP